MTREKSIQACIELLNNEVASKKGLSGFAIRRAYQTLCALKPNAPHRLIDHLFDDFMAEYEKLGPEPKQLGQAWLSIIDLKAKPYQHTALYSAYQMLKPSALAHIEAAIPKLERSVLQRSSDKSKHAQAQTSKPHA